MASTTLFLLLLCCVVSQQAPKLIGRVSIAKASAQDGGTSLIMDKNIDEQGPKVHSIDVENTSTKKLLGDRRRDAFDLDRNRNPGMATTSDKKLEYDSTIKSIPEVSLQKHISEGIRDDRKTGTRQNNQEYGNNIDSENNVVFEEVNDSFGSAGDDTEGQSDDSESAYTFQDKLQSRDESAEDTTTEPKNSVKSEDSVDAFINSDSVGGTRKDDIVDNISSEHDSVSSYIGLNSKREEKENHKYKIDKSEIQNQYANTRPDADGDEEGSVPGKAKDTISGITSNISVDSLSPYIGLQESQTITAIRKNITKNEEKDYSKQLDKTVEGNSRGSLIAQGDASGRTKDVIPKTFKQEDSVASYIETIKKQEEASVPGEAKDKISGITSNMTVDSVSPYIGLPESQKITAIRNNIVKNEKSDYNEQLDKTLEGDSGGTLIAQGDASGRTKDVIPKNIKQEDSVASYIETAKKQEEVIKNEVSASGESVVNDNGDKNDNDDNDDDDDDDDESETLVREFSGEDETSGEDKLQSSKTKAILEGLEEGLSEESSSGRRSKEKLSFGPSLSEKLWHPKPHKKKSKEHSSFVVEKPGLPLRYNLTQYTTLPQYMYVNISDAEIKGAVCLDGSTPGYFYRRGVGSGLKRWIIYLQGGAWCDSEEDCYERSKSNLGSSLKFTYLTNVEGILSRDKTKNPDFYNWNAVYVPYCDGASYTGNRSQPVVFKERLLYLRGKRILGALLDDVLSHGLSDSDKLVFAGTSAGGLAVLLNADYVRSRIPLKVKVYSLADSGIFLDAKDMEGNSLFADSMKAVYKLHESSGSINSKCAAHQGKERAWKCLFPFYFGEYIQSPVFIVNPLHDSWQLANVIRIHCAYKPEKCDSAEMKKIKNFRGETLKALIPFIKNPHIGLFADGCVDHGQIIFSPKWTKILVRNRSISGTFSRWIKNKQKDKYIIDFQRDKYPFNPTCVSHFHD